MEKQEKPLLSIGIIFRNEIRCLERCVKSLQPLRDAVPCELVMADTGSTDGSRGIARKYADIFFDFPWVDDFAAARNAVMDRSSGEWFFTIDADEWLDGDISELADFLRDRSQWQYPFCGVIVRNYSTSDTSGEYGDMLGIRMALMSTQVRYEGAIHEFWDYSGTVRGLGGTVLHHDGYAVSDKKFLTEKKERNMRLLEKEIAQDPQNMRALLQCVESSRFLPSCGQYIRMAIDGVEKKYPYWEKFGAAILRHAVLWAATEKPSKLEEWAAQAIGLFPNSIFTNIDIAYIMFVHYAEQADYPRAIPFGERYLQGLADYREKRFSTIDLIISTLAMAAPSREDGARAVLADAYFHENRLREARDMLLSIDCAKMRPEAVGNYIGVLMNLHAQGGGDLSSVMAGLWEKTGRSGKKQELRAAVIRASAIAFSVEHRAAEDESGFSHAYTLFLPLAGKCGLGTAAAILETGDQQEMERLLRTVDQWDELPITALERALLAGIEFPLAGQPLPLETMDDLASRLAVNQACLPELLDKAVQGMNKNSQAMAWARGLALAALRSADWESGGGSLETVCSFVKVERQFLPLYYTAVMLCEENISLLPPMHRFGWYCVQAFDALDAGDKAGYVRLLHAGLRSCESAKSIVEFLTENTPELQTAQVPQASSELLELAEKVRTLLSAYDPDDPAVLALKQSPAYRKVAWIIEGGEGLPQ